MEYNCIWIILFFAPSKAKKGYILDGLLAGTHEFPYCAHLLINCYHDIEGYDSWICGGSIVNQKLILTAAHCFQPCDRKNVVIKVGNSNYRKGLTHYSSRIKVHENYYSYNYENDIAMVSVTRDFVFAFDVNRVALMERPPVEEAYVAGWGTREVDSHYSEVLLRYVKQELIKHSECKKVIRFKPRGTVCAVLPPGAEKGVASRGDSGAPLVVRKYIQLGIVSFKLLARENPITVYTYVPSFLKWIERAAKELTCKGDGRI